MSTRPATLPKTPTAKTRADKALTTPQNRVAALVAGSSQKRVHFSPRNQEIPSGTTPQSSPTRARARAQARGILKRSATDVYNSDQAHSSDVDGENGLLDKLSSPPPSSPNDEAANDVSAFPQGNKGGVHGAGTRSFSELLEQAIDSLRQADGGSVGVAARVYNELCGLVAKHAEQTAEEHERIMDLLDCILRDICSDSTPRAAVLAAVKCLGCTLHIEKISAAAASSKRLCPLLEALQERAQGRFSADKAMCQAAVWCIGIMRAPATAIQALVPKLVQLCVTLLTRFEASATIQYESLAAFESLLKRAPGATRQIFQTWVFPVLSCVVSQVPGVRAKADGIVRHNIPWIAADVHGPEMDAPVKEFVASKLDRMLTKMDRLLSRGDHVLVARIWGMVITICARHCRPKLNAMLRIIQECFNTTDADALVAAVMQWRCLIYAFALDGRLHTAKSMQLVLAPIMTLLEASEATAVRLACVQCWATLAYALGEELGSHIAMLAKMAQAVGGSNASIKVRSVVARVLTAVFNRLVLPGDKTAQFVIPRMIIGTTTLAAADGKNLSSTRGPFSSESSFAGDHTAILCNYVIGLEPGSPTVPAVLETAVEFIGRYVAAQRCRTCGLVRFAPNDGEADRQAFAGLCMAVVEAIRALRAAGDDTPGALVRTQELAAALAEVFLDTAQDCKPDAARACVECAAGYSTSPRALLFAAIHGGLADALSSHWVDAANAYAIVYSYFGMRAQVLGTRFTSKPPHTFESPCALAMGIAHISGMLRQLAAAPDASIEHSPVPAAVVELVAGLAGELSLPADTQGVCMEKAVAAMMALACVLDRSGSVFAHEPTRQQMQGVLATVAENFPVPAESPQAAFFADKALHIHGLLPPDHGAADSLARIVRLSAGSMPRQSFWQTAYDVLLDLTELGRLAADGDGVRLVLELIGGDCDRSAACYCAVLVVVIDAVMQRAQGSVRGSERPKHTAVLSPFVPQGPLDTAKALDALWRILTEVVATLRAKDTWLHANIARDLRAMLDLVSALTPDDVESGAESERKRIGEL
ncbi:DNA-binding protein rif1, partial [Coemansia sp. RSA 2706]